MSDTEFQQRVGTTLRGKWTLDRLIGVGGMAAVYAATHKIGRIDAIKLLDPAIAVSPELRARFEQEARAVNSIGHPGAVEVRDIDETEDGTPFLVMELLEGQTIAERMAEGKAVAPSELLRLVDELLDVLSAAHAKQIIHRDIKPENLFLLRDGKLKVLDFGIARMRDGVRTMIGTMMGTLAYMPPEQIKGMHVDERADLFAVGATMFRVLAGRTVHVAENDWLLGSRILQHPAPLLASVAPAVPEWVCWIVDRALQHRAEDRYPDAATMQRDVRAVRDGREPPYAAAKLREPTVDEAVAGRGAPPLGPVAPGVEPSSRAAATRSERPASGPAEPRADAEPVHVPTKAFPFGLEPAKRPGEGDADRQAAQGRVKVSTDKQLPAFAEQPTTAPQLPAFVVGARAASSAARPGVPPTQPQMPAFPDPAAAEPPANESSEAAATEGASSEAAAADAESSEAAAAEAESSEAAATEAESSEAAAAEAESSEAAAAEPPANESSEAAATGGASSEAAATEAESSEAVAADAKLSDLGVAGRALGARGADLPPDPGTERADAADDAAEPTGGEQGPAPPLVDEDGPAAAASDAPAGPSGSDEPSDDAPPSAERGSEPGDEASPPVGTRRLSTTGFVALLVVVAAVALGYWAYATGRLPIPVGGSRPSRPAASQQSAPVESAPAIQDDTASPPSTSAPTDAPDEPDGSAPP